jgi:hypothetical protein
VVGGKGSSFRSVFWGTAGGGRPGGKTRVVGGGDGGEGTQVREGGGRTIGGVGSWGGELIVTDLAAISFLSSFRSFPTPFSLTTISCIIFRIVVDGFSCHVGVVAWYMCISLILPLSLSFRSFLSIGFVPMV